MMTMTREVMTMDEKQIGWKQLLAEALTKPGILSEAYSAFHNYSSGNQMLAAMECFTRGIKLGPIATFMGWKDKGRSVMKGQKAIALWMPITGKKTVVKQAEDGTEQSEEMGYTRFVMKNNWFVLSQTEGKEYEAEPVPGWSEDQALNNLSVTKIDYTEPNGNCQGVAFAGRKFAINPLAVMPHKTTFHELAHIVLGHCEETLTDSERTPKNLKEVEAESVALICCESLGLPGAEYSRGYIQSWAGFTDMPEESARKIFKAADQIIKAGNLKEGSR